MLGSKQSDASNNDKVVIIPIVRPSAPRLWQVALCKTFRQKKERKLISK